MTYTNLKDLPDSAEQLRKCFKQNPFFDYLVALIRAEAREIVREELGKRDR